MVIDFTKKYKVQSVPSKDPGLKELAAKGFSVLPFSSRAFSAKHEDGRWTDTGLDDESIEVNNLDGADRAKAKAAIKKRREHLEMRIGKPGHLEPTSDAWETEAYCKPVIDVTKDFRIRASFKGTDTFEPEKYWQDEVRLGVILNDPTFPKSKADLAKPQYKDAPFYLTSEEDEVTFDSETRKIKNEANRELDLLIDAVDKTRLLEVGYYLEMIGGFSEDADKLGNNLITLLEKDTEGKIHARLVKALKVDEAYMKAFNTIKRAYDLGIVIKDKGSNTYVRGAIQYKESVEDSAKLLTSPGHEMEFVELWNEVSKRRKKAKVK